MLRDLLLNSKVILFLSIVLGFTAPVVGSVVGEYIVPLIVVVMTVSMRKVSLTGLSSYRWRDIFGLLAVNYVVLSAVYIAAAYAFFSGVYRSSVVLLGLMPPAVGIISLTYLFDGELDTSFVAEVAGYAASLVLVPVGVLYVVGASVSTWSVLRTVLTLIALPFVLSRVVRWVDQGVEALSEDVFKLVFNVCYGATFFGSIALNRDVLVGNPWQSAWFALILFGIRFVLASGWHWVLHAEVDHGLDVDYVLFSTFKNGGAAIGFAVALFGVEATLPLAVNAVVVPLHIIYVDSVLLSYFD